MPLNNETPSARNLRSNSQSDLTLSNIKVLIDASKDEIINSVRAEMLILKESISSLSSRVDELERENKALKHQHQILLKQPNTDSMAFEGACSGLVDELQQRERRKLNLVVFGMAEPVSGSVDDRKSVEKKKCHELFEAIGMSSCLIKDVSRIGKLVDGRNRILRVTVDTEDNKHFIISHSKNLRHKEQFKGVYVKPDLTQFQRKLDFELRKELKNSRSVHPDKDFIIYRGKIVERSSIQGFRKDF